MPYLMMNENQKNIIFKRLGKREKIIAIYLNDTK